MIYKTFKKGNKVLKIVADEQPESPREWDNLGLMICRHRDYSLGDEQLSDNFEGSFEDLKSHLIKERGAVVILPLRLYDHSGLSISTTSGYPFNCRWDASEVGYIIATREAIKENFGLKRNITAKHKERVLKILQAEVETYDQYLRGDVYGFEIVEPKKCDLGHTHEEHLDSCYGFYGDDFKDNGLFENAGVDDIETWEEVSQD